MTVEQAAIFAMKDALGYFEQNARTYDTIELRKALQNSLGKMQKKYGKAESMERPLPHPYAAYRRKASEKPQRVIADA